MRIEKGKGFRTLIYCRELSPETITKMKHWRWWSQMNEKNMEGQTRQAVHRFLDLDGKFLKSRDPLLEKLKERISLGLRRQ